jgi:(R,R)-butanediol dehydrogenase/meso-butanediol dehydrogenase/diacetyl reductase
MGARTVRMPFSTRKCDLHCTRYVTNGRRSRRPCGPDEVRLKVAYCGICGTDIHEYLGGPIFCPPLGGQNPHTGLKLPITLGHEFSGTVVEIGSNVKNVRAGQNVAVDPTFDDRHYGLDPCIACQHERYNVCKRWTAYGLSAPGGGIAEEIVVKAMNCMPLPASVSLKVGALVEPLAVAWHAIRLSAFQPGQTALVLGAGPIGLAILMLLRVWGASTIVVTEVTHSRAEQAKKFGADLVINPLDAMARTGKSGTAASDPVKTAVLQMTADQGVDVSFDATGIQSTLDSAITSTKIGGTIFNVAIHEKPLQLHLNDLVFAEKRLLGGMCYTDEDFAGVLDALEKGKIPHVEQMVTSVVPLSNAINGGILELINNKAAHVKILIQPGA